MGYDIKIKRIDSRISMDEWITYVNSDPEFKLINDFSANSTSGLTITTKTPNSGLWKNEVPFVFDEKNGDITVKSPDILIIEKMLSVSKQLNATVAGEEDEVYDEKFIQMEKNKKPINIDDYKNIKMKLYNPEKKWWQFWKKGTHL